MSRSCDLCGKKAMRANHVSHAKNRVPRRQKPNLQLLTVANGKVRACSTCRRTSVKKAA
ncbi:MAG: 50S ribosomal protein L28 [Candidatus Magasanikbacteria bacterium RIFOXYA2_FULL_44_8]|uniref:Large ribosomal subunit protein bL28 n=1 Tax=Candidatus Magasanikbacteria bacterium RIFOXYA2_FULL_44_8 TaxID=1798696 RepID=A0A1F6NIU6_9BACT|nr:MAG: 50S ribosomal protein L28 [Candidatus Magasanikbacteria bacterium RIFOXYA2_FULL_44_8]